MSKKIVFVLLLCIVALSCAYAGKAVIVAQASPFSFQSVAASGGTYKSTYGFGASGGIRVDLWKNVSAGIDLSVGIYKFDELDSDYDVIGLRGVVGYSYDFTDMLFADADFGLGIDIRKVGSAERKSLGMDLYLGCGYWFADELAVTAGADCALGFQVGKNSRSTDFELKTKLGLYMAL
jgi:hypothetical protein